MQRKQRNSKRAKKQRRNPVKKFMDELTKPATHKDKKNDYERRPKHKGKDWE